MKRNLLNSTKRSLLIAAAALLFGDYQLKRIATN